MLKNRSEILFIYDIRDANPNGDPMDENKPRMDEETGQVIVSDVRLKRTVRDYLDRVKGLEVFIKELQTEGGKLKTKEERFENEFGNDPSKVLERCIDLRLFGATLAMKERRMTVIGPVQFKFGRSLHRVKGPILVKGTTVMPSQKDKEQGTFREEWIVPYALIGFYGVVNQHAAKDTGLTEEDVNLLLEALWNGTKELITRSKFGQMPRFLMQIVYKEGINFYIGELDKFIGVIREEDIEEEEIRDISQVVLNFSPLLEQIKLHRDKIAQINIGLDRRVSTSPVELISSLNEILPNHVKTFEFVS